MHVFFSNPFSLRPPSTRLLAPHSPRTQSPCTRLACGVHLALWRLWEHFAQHRLTGEKPPWKPSQQNTRKKANQVTAHPCSFTAPGKGKKKKKGKKGGRGDEKGKKGGKKKNLHDSPPHAARSPLLSPPLPPSGRLAPFVPTPCTPCLGDLGDLHPNSTGSK